MLDGFNGVGDAGIVVRVELIVDVVDAYVIFVVDVVDVFQQCVECCVESD